MFTTACAKQVDRFTIDRVLDRATAFPDLDMVCGIGRSLTHPLGAVSSRDPDRALVVAEGVAGLCAQIDAWEMETATARVRANLGDLPLARAAEVTDARIRGERAHALAAQRFERSWQHLRSAYPGVEDGDCPKIKDKDEFVYVFGLITGTMALLHDRAGGGSLGIGLDRPLEVARGTTCLPEEAWWSLPLALRAGAWATVPGSAPEGIDPWVELERAAVTGAVTGVRASAAIRVMIAANAGKSDIVLDGIRAFPDASGGGMTDEEWLLLDAYATLVVLHQSDLVWTQAVGHRTERLGVLPSDGDPPFVEGPDLFGDDPFGADDPFGTDPEDPQTDIEEPEETP